MAKSKNRPLIRAVVRRYEGNLTDIPKLKIWAWKEVVMLADIKLEDRSIADIYWFKVGKSFVDLNAQTGDTIEFNATVEVNKVGSTIKYELKIPTNLTIIDRDPSLYPGELARTVGSGVDYAKGVDKNLWKANTPYRENRLDLFDTRNYQSSRQSAKSK